MRTPKYLSPTSLKVFEENQTQFYLNYLADNRPDRFPQTIHMAVGSAFDAYVKSYLYNVLYGKLDPKFAFEALFEAQVEVQNRTTALKAGAWAFECYKKSGALIELLGELRLAIGPVSFEFDILGVANGYREGITIKECDVPIFGKPDIRFMNQHGARITYDWKVNGFWGKSNTSPKPGYIRCLDGWGYEIAKPSRSNGERHKDCNVILVDGVQINCCYFETIDRDWADQLATYQWLLGEPIGRESIIGIDQLACAPSGVEGRPMIRVAQHRSRVSENYQYALLARYQNLWHRITSGHFFTELTLEESQSKCAELDKNSLAIKDGMSEEEQQKIRLMRGF